MAPQFLAAPSCLRTNYPDRLAMRDAKPPLPFTGELARHATSRRDFLRIAGLGGAALLLPAAVTACSEAPVDPRLTAEINLAVDSGVENFAYLLIQLKQTFISWVYPYSPYPGITLLERASFSSIGSHMSSQKLLFWRTAQNSISDLVRFEFNGIDFSQRSSVFPAAIEICEVVAATFPWLVANAHSAETATILAKMGSLHSRHAATLRDLQDIKDGRSASAERVAFAGSDVVPSATGLHRILTPREAMDRLGQYIITPVSLRGA